jgi:hypothetical protein
VLPVSVEHGISYLFLNFLDIKLILSYISKEFKKEKDGKNQYDSKTIRFLGAFRKTNYNFKNSNRISSFTFRLSRFTLKIPR